MRFWRNPNEIGRETMVMRMRMKRKEEAMEMKLPVFRSKEECIEKFYLARESGVNLS